MDLNLNQDIFEIYFKMSKKEIVMKQDSKQIHLYINNDTCYIIDIEKKDVTK